MRRRSFRKHRSSARSTVGLSGRRHRVSNRKFGRRARPHRANAPHRAMRGGIRF